jgi:hypothetical protein
MMPLTGGLFFFTFDPSTCEGVTWLWDGEDWSKADMNPNITGVEHMVYDTRHQVLLLFAVGGDKLAGFHEALWGWNGSAWDRVHRGRTPDLVQRLSREAAQYLLRADQVGVDSGLL